eukprot:c24326_g1_i1 orf=437-1699(-)
MATLAIATVGFGFSFIRVYGVRTVSVSRGVGETNLTPNHGSSDRRVLGIDYGTARKQIGQSVSPVKIQGYPSSAARPRFGLMQFKSVDPCKDVFQSLTICQRVPRSGKDCGCTVALAMEVAEGTFLWNRGVTDSREVGLLKDSSPSYVKLPPKNRADDASLHNPLLRLERMGCGWLGILIEWDGVILDDDGDIERKAWTALAEEEGKRLPPTFVLKRAEGMKNEQAISEVFCWSRDPRQMKRLAQRKEELYQVMQGGIYRLKPGSREFILALRNYNIPIAVVSTRPRKVLERAIEAVGMEGLFTGVVAAEDVYRGKPDPEMFIYAAQLLDIIPDRCIVFGSSNSSIEAAHDACMKCIAMAGKHPMFELGAADLVVTRLDNLSFVDLKNLSDLESPEFQHLEPEPEPQLEHLTPRTGIALY